MSTVLSDSAVNQIVSLLGIKAPECTEIFLTKAEVEKLYALVQEQKNPFERIKLKSSGSNGIGSAVNVVIDNKETDITDYDSW